MNVVPLEAIQTTCDVESRPKLRESFPCTAGATRDEEESGQTETTSSDGEEDQ